MKRTLLKIKWENITLPLTFYYSVMQIIKAHEDFKTIALFMGLTIMAGVYFVIMYNRKEALKNIKRLHIEEQLQKQYKEAIKKEELKAQIRTRQMFEMLESL